MKTDQIVLVSNQGWFRFFEVQSQSIKPWSDIQGPALVVVDFYESQVGIQACKGKADYAAAQIEKQVRSEGSIEGPLHVFVHRQVRHAESSLALYTAVSLEFWQGFQTWSNRQADHCLVMPLAALLSRGVTEDQLLVLRVGSQLHGFSAYNNKMFYAGATALGNETSDLFAPLKTLLNQLRASGWKGSSKSVRWASVFSDDLDDDRALLERLATAGLVEAKLLEHESLRSETSPRSGTALPQLLEQTSASSLHAPLMPRLAWLSEAYVLPVAAMITVVSIGLGALAFFTQKAVDSQVQAAQAVAGEVQTLRQRVAAATPSENSPKMAPAAVEFVKQLGFAAVNDPVRMLSTVRRAAGASVRVQRLQLSRKDQSAPPHFRVDGVVIDGSNEGLRRFLSELRMQGWQADSVQPNDSAPGAFAYALEPVTTGQGI
jgi:hypothetical protein